jgi:hypothetical protein
VFGYTIEPSQSTDALGVTGLNTNGATIADAAGNTLFTGLLIQAFPSLEINVGTSIAVPILSDAGNTVGYLSGGAGVTVDSALSITDSVESTLVGATVEVGEGFLLGDSLSFASEPGITGSYDSADRVLVLSGTASISEYQTALQSVVFTSSAGDPTAGNTDRSRLITWSVSDALAASVPVTSTIEVELPQAPTLFEVFTSDTSLDLQKFLVDGPVAVAALTNFDTSPTADIVAPTVSFSPTLGLEMSSASGRYTEGGIQTVQSFEAPFTVTAVGTVESIGAGPLVLSISNQDGGAGVELAAAEGAFSSDSGFFFAGPSGEGTHWAQLGQLSSTLPTIGQAYTFDISVDAAGTADLSVTSGGSVIGTSSTTVGTGPFYPILSEGWGAFATGNPNEAAWGSLQVTPTSEPAPAITSVDITGTLGDYTLTIAGNGFGNAPSGVPGLGDTPDLRVGDGGNPFGEGEWGYSGDANALNYVSWSNTQVVVSGLDGSPGDALTLALWNPASGIGAAWGGNVPGGAVDTPIINSVQFSGSGQSLSMTIQGSGFGSAPPDLASGDTPYFAFTDWRTHQDGSSLFSAGNAPFGSSSGDPVTLQYASWTSNEIIVDGFAGSYGQDDATVQAGDPVTITLYNSSDVNRLGPQTAWAGDVAPCYVEGTRIATPLAEVPVEALRVGDHVVSALGGTVAVTWLGHRRVDCRHHPKPQGVWPVRVAAGAFGANQPRRDLWLSPDHAVFFGGVLIPIRYLVNGSTVVQERTDEITYWHVELPRHDILLAEGLPCESYLDTGNRGAFANGGTAMHLHPNFALRIWEAEACAKLVRDGAELEQARRCLIDAAKALGFKTTDDPDLHLQVNGTTVPPRLATGGLYRFPVPAEARQITILSRSGIPAEIATSGKDTRQLGVMFERVIVRGKGWSRPIPLEAMEDGEGFYPLEVEGKRRWRWTNGNARLNLPDDLTPGEPFVLDLHVVAAQTSWIAPVVARARIPAGAHQQARASIAA